MIPFMPAFLATTAAITTSVLATQAVSPYRSSDDEDLEEGPAWAWNRKPFWDKVLRR